MLTMNLSSISKLAFLMILSVLMCPRPCMSSNWTVSCNAQERKGLQKVKHSLQDPSNLLSSWKGRDCCRWSGVTCHRPTGRIIKLELQKTRMSDDSWARPNKPTVHYGNLKFKPFGAVILSSGLASLRYLTHLDLSGIWFAKTTVVPEFFASLKQLRHLRLVGSGQFICTDEDNVLCYSPSGKLVVRNVQWLSHLQALRSLTISGAKLLRPVEFIRVLNQLPSLSVLGLAGCELENSHLSHFNSTFLAQVRYLYLSGNYFRSPIPSVFGNMTSLQYLDLSMSFSFSSIPVWFGNPRSLLHIDLSYNDIDNVGEVLLSLLENNRRVKSIILGCEYGLLRFFPSHYNSSRSIGDSLELLDLSNCNISGPWPSLLGGMKKLRNLLLPWNSFTGSIPTLPNLQELDLASNNLDEVNLTSLGRLSRMESLILSNNMLKGNLIELLPKSFEKLTNLKTLDLSFNQLEGTIPPAIGKLVTLELLYLDNNYLKGSIPISLGTLSQLNEISFFNNGLEGTIPESLGHLQTLRFLDLSSNRLNGSIPESIGQLSNLVDLYLNNNSLDGMVSEAHFSNLSKLKFLSIGLNDLTFNISSNWCPPFQLLYIFLQSCKFKTVFPKWIKTQKKATFLHLSNAYIRGPIPKWFRDMQFYTLDLSNNLITGDLSNLPHHLRYLYLSNNFISGCLPPNISKIMPSLIELYLSNNSLSGPLPASLCVIEYLSELDLSRNNLIGDIPNCLGNGSFLSIIIFSSNKLFGKIPKSIGQLFQLWSLQLDNNNLYGQLPEDLQNCAQLVILDLSENNLSGNLPSWIATNLGFLRILRLRGNKFYGGILGQLCDTRLQILDLGNNNLTGNIPPCLMRGAQAEIEPPTWTWDAEHVEAFIKGRYLEYSGNIQLLVNLDLSSNHLVGSIPSELFSISRLLGLNLSHNNLSGNIPCNIREMISLESLDLSNNQLSGSIPQGLSSLSSLSHLNLANDKLIGQIPQGNQLQTIYAADPSIYDGNPLLCGNPLPQKCDETKTLRAAGKALKRRKEYLTDEAILFIITAFGYAIGLWGVILALIFKKSWRIAYFKFIDETVDKVYVAIAVKLAKIHRRW